VAIKILKENLRKQPDFNEIVERFLREFTAMKELNHKGLVKALDAGQEDGELYL